MLRAQLEMSQVRQEIDRRIQEKEEEFEHSRKNHQRALESMQASLEAEARAKEEALRIKKKNEADINEMEIIFNGTKQLVVCIYRFDHHISMSIILLL